MRVTLFGRLLFAIGGCAALSIGVALVLQDRSLARDLAAGAARRIEVARRSADRLIETHLATIAARYESISGTPQFRANLEVDHPPTLEHFAGQLLAREHAAQLAFIGGDGRTVASAGEAVLDPSAAPRDGPTLVARDRSIHAVVVIPLWTDRTVVGHLLAVEPIHPEVAAGWSELCGAEVLFRRPDPSTDALTETVREFPEITVYVRTSLDHEVAARLHARVQLILAGLIAFAAAMVLSGFLSRGFAGPIRAIERATDQIASGDYSARVEIRRKDEIGAVAHSVNRMARKIQESSDAIRHANEGLLATSRELALSRDRAEALGRAKSEFLAGKSPAIRSALDGILSMAEILARSDLSPDQVKYVRATQVAARKLLGLLIDILDLARLETERVELDAIDFPFGEAVESAVANFAESAAAQGIFLFCAIDAAVPASVRGDPQRLGQIISHLLAHAIRHTPRLGEVVVRVGPPRPMGDEIELEVVVEDTGGAIREDRLADLFEPMARGSTEGAGRGAEFGLAICRRLVGLMGGGIEARNNAAGGASLTATMRVRPSHSHYSTIETLLEATDVAALRVLVVDPVRTSREILVSLIAAWGAATAAEANPERALERLCGARGARGAAEKYDVVVIHVPERADAARDLVIRAKERLQTIPKWVAIVPTGAPSGAEEFAVTIARPARREMLLEALLSGRSPTAPRDPRAAPARGQSEDEEDAPSVPPPGESAQPAY